MSEEDKVRSTSSIVTDSVFKLVRKYQQRTTYEDFCADMYDSKQDDDIEQKYHDMLQNVMSYYFTLDKKMKEKFCDVLNGDVSGDRPAKKAKKDE